MLRFTLTYPLAVALISLLIQCTSEVAPQGVDLPMEDFQVGDIVFRRGESIASQVVLFNDPEGKYSHVGMIAQGDSGLIVVHALPGSHPTQPGVDLVRAETLYEFFAPENAISGMVVRMPLNDMQRSELSRRALLKVKQQTDFDNSYDCQDTTKLYCTELLQLLYSHVGVNLSEGRTTKIYTLGSNSGFIMPADIYRNSQLKTIFSF